MNDERNTLDAVLLEHYVAGDATEAQQRAVDAWAAASPGRRAELDRLIVVFSRGSTRHDVRHREERWEQLRAEMTRRGLMSTDAPDARAATSRLRPARRVGLFTGVGLAVVAIAAVGVATMNHRSESIPPEHHIYRTGVGEHARVQLMDGSTVLLNASSTLRVPIGFGATTRTVTLDGQARFDVQHASGAPFIVDNGTTRVTVLGTTFVVRRYPTDHVARIAVINGRVSVLPLSSENAQPVALTGRTVAEVTDSGRTSVLPDSDLASDLGWTTGRLVFRDTPLREALPDVERRYNLIIRMAGPSMGDKAITATLDEEDAESAIRLLALALNVRYERRGRIVTLLPLPAPAASPRRTPLSTPAEVNYGR